MRYLLNFAYLTAAALLAPYFAYRRWSTGRYRRGLRVRLTGAVAPRPAAPTAWFHGVSVGEIHLLKPLVDQWREQHPAWRCVISTTTDTGREAADRQFPDLAVIDWPFDLTWSVRTALERVKPSLVVLAEGELWPNFLWEARRQNIKVAVVNGRMSPRTAARLRMARGLVGGMLRSVDWIGAQTEEYAEHYRACGARQVCVTGNLKYDGVRGDRNHPEVRAKRRLLGLADDALVWLVGSSQSPEEIYALPIYMRAKRLFPNLRLILVPRHRERFDEVAAMISASGLPLARRSLLQGAAAADPDAVILGDTMGELGVLWGLADVAYVGGSLDGKRGGQNMIEPAAYGAAVLFGPHTWNFRETVRQLLAHDAALQVQDASELESAVLALLEDAAQRAALGQRARDFVLTQQGATARTLASLSALLLPEPQQLAA